MEEGPDEMESGAERKLTGQIIIVEQNLTAGDMREYDLANPLSKQEDCRVHWILLSSSLTKWDLMSSEAGLELHLMTQIVIEIDSWRLDDPLIQLPRDIVFIEGVSTPPVSHFTLAFVWTRTSGSRSATT